ncbi:hypothetical protein MHHB_P0495 [Methanofervidicoccus abyssi]|uniref:Uncharacterized protein n=1 Tax=Methanofervidicoccus abyssi TaxID=2082189 RepID=A0A401HPY9_9EURY|nr:hypothetical protein MHHB_P0495 [Methanofervidicoccus abyssi]
MINPDYFIYYGTEWIIPRNNPPYVPPVLVNLTKTTQYLKKSLLEEVFLEPMYPRINIDNRAYVYPYGVVSKDEDLKRHIETVLKRHGLYFYKEQDYICQN